MMADGLLLLMWDEGASALMLRDDFGPTVLVAEGRDSYWWWLGAVTGCGCGFGADSLCGVDSRWGMDCVSYRGGCGLRTWVWLRSLGADLNFAEFYFGKMLGVRRGSCVGRESGGQVGILGLGERGVLGMELSSFMYPRARAHYARVCVRVRGGRLLKSICVCSTAFWGG